MILSLRKQYPERWQALAAACKEKARWCCEHCGARQHEIRTSARGTPYFVYLHAAHKYHDKANPSPELICLCPSCHGRFDHERRARQARVRIEMLRHLRLLVDAGAISVWEDPTGE